MNRIFVLSDKIGCGKTTYLSKSVSADPDCFSGVLAPVYRGKRYLYLINEKQQVELEYSGIDEEDESVISVGKHKFIKSAFDKANKSIIAGLSISNKIMIIDELGPLELARQGLYESIIAVLNSNISEISILLLIIREKLLDEVISFFNLSPIKIFSLTEIMNNDLISVLKTEV